MDAFYLPLFDPPFESPIEEAFAWTMSKHLAAETRWEKQVVKETLCGPFRLDFHATDPRGYRIGFECDGADYHEIGRDEWRDAALLGDAQIDAIVRVRGQDIHFRMDDVAFVLAHLYPNLFTTRGRIVIEQLASPQVKAQIETEPGIIAVYYPPDFENDVPPTQLQIFYRTQVDPPGMRQFWRVLYKYAQEHGGGSIDTLQARFLSRAPVL